MRKLDNSQSAEIVLVTGSSGARKTTWLKKKTARRTRLAIYDAAKHEYGDVVQHIARNKRELLDLLKSNKSGKLRVAYQPPRPEPNDFNFFCRAVYAWANCTVIVEELADVTSSGKAPQGWGDILRKGRAFSMKVFAATQRPAESDKTIIGNATLIHAGRQSRFKDQKYMADEMALSADDFKMLPGHWIEYDMQKLEHKRGET
jgi:hypothetical protein